MIAFKNGKLISVALRHAMKLKPLNEVHLVSIPPTSLRARKSLLSAVHWLTQKHAMDTAAR